MSQPQESISLTPFSLSPIIEETPEEATQSSQPQTIQSSQIPTISSSQSQTIPSSQIIPSSQTLTPHDSSYPSTSGSSFDPAHDSTTTDSNLTEKQKRDMMIKARIMKRSNHETIGLPPNKRMKKSQVNSLLNYSFHMSDVRQMEEYQNSDLPSGVS
jgi:hypothetical protein